MSVFGNKNSQPSGYYAQKVDTPVSRVLIDINNLITKTQEHLTAQYGNRLFELERPQIENYIKQYAIDNHYYANGEDGKPMSIQLMVATVYEEMAEFSVLTPYLVGTNKEIEEININSWDDIEIIPADGKPRKLKETFRNATHAEDTVRRLLRQSKKTLDSSTPITTGFIGKNIRVTAVTNDIVGTDAGVAASIRIVNAKKLGKADFLRFGTCTKAMYDFLTAAFICGISECYAGETGSGKTTIMADIMSNYPADKRIITIEKSVREFDLVRRDENGKITNNVLHFVTRESDDKTKSVTMNDLLTVSLTMDPDAICVAEMKNEEAWAAQEAARTGHAVLTTTHASSAHGVYTRLATLCLQAYSNIPFDVILRLVCEAFPIAVYQHKLEDGTRRVTEIAECIYNNEKRDYDTVSLWKYEVLEKHKGEGESVEITGRFVKKNNISENLQKRLLQNGIDRATLDTFLREDVV